MLAVFRDVGNEFLNIKLMTSRVDIFKSTSALVCTSRYRKKYNSP